MNPSQGPAGRAQGADRLARGHEGAVQAGQRRRHRALEAPSAVGRRAGVREGGDGGEGERDDGRHAARQHPEVPDEDEARGDGDERAHRRRGAHRAAGQVAGQVELAEGHDGSRWRWRTGGTIILLKISGNFKYN